MKILAEHVEKKFRQEWVVRSFSYQFESGQSYALTGPNGSGKSTLLRILAQYSLPTKGQVTFLHEDFSSIESDQCHSLISYAAPYVELIEEFTLSELLNFLIQLKALPAQLSLAQFQEYIELQPDKSKYIKNYSSGMRQKIKLGIALMADKPCMFFDEPTTNLDEKAKNWFYQKIKEQSNQLIIIASNEAAEINLCQHRISILDFK
ncbi:ABC transporter ATP-binding protein [Cytophagaceae bacterium 50C-KIRBA]|uniref:ABC transporter ATP-binding protein n=1 Tax=Aquirufa beregesia TaxID=2516556 RepID=A0ABX0ESL6_9BACT|nr:ABC transporter ATP-binding protein [Aquirufa beregesia]NGZ43036.1 ABC transporter ATP-binding protein [Aquirufa beregesia]